MNRHQASYFEIAVLQTALDDLEWYGAVRQMDIVADLLKESVVDLARRKPLALRGLIEAALVERRNSPMAQSQ